MLHATFCPFVVSSIPLIRSGAVSNRTWISAEKVSLSACWIAARCSAGRSNALRTSAGSSRCLERRGEACFRLAVHLPQAASEHLAQAFFQTRRGEIRQRLSRDGKHFLLGPATDGLIQVMSVVSQRFLSLGTQGIGRLPRFVEEPLTFGFRLVRRLAQECGALLVELLVLVLELVALLLGFGLFRVGIREFRGDPLLPRVDGVENGPDTGSASTTTPG